VSHVRKRSERREGDAGQLTRRLSGELVDVDEVAVDGEERGVLAEELLEAGLRTAGDLAHLLGEPFGAELAAEVVEGARTALVHQPLEEEEQRLVAHHFVLAALHPLARALAVRMRAALLTNSRTPPPCCIPRPLHLTTDDT